MRTSILALAAVAALGFSTAQASAATLLIDGFDSYQRVTDIPTPPLVNFNELADAAVLGGFREMEVSTVMPSADASELRVEFSALSFSNNSFAQGSGSIVYDGENSDGLGGFDLTLGGLANPMFVFEVLQFDLDVAIEVVVRDTAGLFAKYKETLTGGFNPNLAFTEFTTDAGFNFASVDSLAFFVSSEDTVINVDGAIGSISISAVPLPASALLLLGGLGGLGAMRRRKNKATA